MDFKDVVKAHPITPTSAATPAALSSKLGAIDAAAGKLSSAAYPLLKDVDWSSDLALKPLPGTGPPQGHRKHRRQARDLGERFRGCQRGARQGDCVRADQPGHGRLQCLWQDRESGRPELPLQLCESR